MPPLLFVFMQQTLIGSFAGPPHLSIPGAGQNLDLGRPYGLKGAALHRRWVARQAKRLSIRVLLDTVGMMLVLWAPGMLATLLMKRMALVGSPGLSDTTLGPHGWFSIFRKSLIDLHGGMPMVAACFALTATLAQ